MPMGGALFPNCLQDDLREVDFLANRILMLRLATCVEVVCVLREHFVTCEGSV